VLKRQQRAKKRRQQAHEKREKDKVSAVKPVLRGPYSARGSSLKTPACLQTHLYREKKQMSILYFKKIHFCST
jgi:hypothetical protein